MRSKSTTYNLSSLLSAGVVDIFVLVKFKLTLTVVITSMLAYGVAVISGGFNWSIFSLLAIGGFFIASAANALNQVLEKDFDSLMNRTKDRPVASGRMKSSDAVMIAGLLSLIGIILLALINPLTAFLGMISLVSYAFIYTPLKRYSPIAVSVGAIPGALPALIGVTAASGQLTWLGLSLFAIQFLWQFPHFWAIAFLGFEDYSKAGYKLVPLDEDGEVDQKLGLYASIYALLLVPVCIAFGFLMNAPLLITSIASILSIAYVLYSYKFYQDKDRESARKLMFFSFAYMPLVFLLFLFI